MNHSQIKTKEQYEKHIEEHCQSSLKEFGLRAEYIHRYIDGYYFPQFENQPHYKG